MRELRRRTVSVDGEQRLADGTVRRIDRTNLTTPLDNSLKAMSVAMPLLAIFALASHY